MAKRKSLDELEILSPKELGQILIYEIYKSRVDFEYIKDLIAAGALLEARDSDGWTPLHWAASIGYTEIVESLIAAGAPLEARTTNSGQTPLHFAARWKDGIEIVESLIAAGASLEAKDNEGMTPLHWAAYIGCAEGVKLLLAAGASKDVLNNYIDTPWNVVNHSIKNRVQELNPDYYG